MEVSSILQMPLEIKMDPQGVERKQEFLHLRSWTRATVKLEAVQCFPCYVKLSLLPRVSNDGQNLVVRINIPGMSVQLATSRTKKFSYGMFWKNNRKRCCAFLSFESQVDCEQHMKWMKYWIKCLEFYRQDILLSRRASRFKANETNDSMSSNINNTQLVKDINEVLGPLPKIPVPDLDQDWIHRQSVNASGIYEEIDKFRKDDLTLSRASGIYEAVKEESEPEKKVEPKEEEFMPPLPPRKRLNTRDFVLKRSHTNTETDYKSKKKSWTTQIMQGLTKRFDSPKGSPKGNSKKTRKGSVGEKVDETGGKKIVLRNNHLNKALQKNKRNSFSSPDLLNLPDSINFTRGSLEFNFFDNPDALKMSADFLNMSFKRTSSESCSSGVVADFEPEIQSLNISAQIRSSFVASNTSIVNLAGSDHIIPEPIYQVPKNIPVGLIDDMNGYCIMKSPQKTENVTMRRDFGPVECAYLPMNGVKSKLSVERPESGIIPDIVATCSETEPSTDTRVEPIYANIEQKKRTEKEVAPVTPKKKRNSRPVSHNIDEKVASYYPNEIIYSKPKKLQNGGEKTPQKTDSELQAEKSSSNSSSPVSLGNLSLSPRIRAKNNIYTPSPTPKHPHSPVKTTPLQHNLRPTQSQSDADLSDLFSPVIPMHKGRIKYATVGRSDARNFPEIQQVADISPTISSIVVNESSSSLSRRFASLPRFKKFNFSPLRVRINNVLQRYQSNGGV